MGGVIPTETGILKQMTLPKDVLIACLTSCLCKPHWVSRDISQSPVKMTLQVLHL